MINIGKNAPIQCFKVYKIIGGGAKHIHTLPRSMISKLNFQDGISILIRKISKWTFGLKKMINLVKKEKECLKEVKNSETKNKAVKEQLPHYELSMANIIK